MHGVLLTKKKNAELPLFLSVAPFLSPLLPSLLPYQEKKKKKKKRTTIAAYLASRLRRNCHSSYLLLPSCHHLYPLCFPYHWTWSLTIFSLCCLWNLCRIE
jgi:hypothetical protein